MTKIFTNTKSGSGTRAHRPGDSVDAATYDITGAKNAWQRSGAITITDYMISLIHIELSGKKLCVRSVAYFDHYFRAGNLELFVVFAYENPRQSFVSR